MDTLSGLVVFVRAAETLSFVGTARTLGVSASAVGKSIAKLEAGLGVRLFHRSTRRISLTDEGALFFERCRTALQDIEDAEAELSRATTTPHGRLRISLPAVGYRLLLPIIPQFRAAYPDIDLDLDFNDRLVDVIEEGFDAVIRGGKLADSRLKATPLGPYRFVVCMSPQYAAQHGQPRSAADLADHVCLRFKYLSSGKLQDWQLDGESALQGMRKSTQLVFNNTEAVLSAAIQGLGIAHLPDFVARDALAEGRLQTVLDACRTHAGTFWIVWPANRHMVPRLRVFVDFLRQHLFPGEASTATGESLKAAAG